MTFRNGRPRFLLPVAILNIAISLTFIGLAVGGYFRYVGNSSERDRFLDKFIAEDVPRLREAAMQRRGATRDNFANYDDVLNAPVDRERLDRDFLADKQRAAIGSLVFMLPLALGAILMLTGRWVRAIGIVSGLYLILCAAAFIYFSAGIVAPGYSHLVPRVIAGLLGIAGTLNVVTLAGRSRTGGIQEAPSAAPHP